MVRAELCEGEDCPPPPPLEVFGSPLPDPVAAASSSKGGITREEAAGEPVGGAEADLGRREDEALLCKELGSRATSKLGGLVLLCMPPKVGAPPPDKGMPNFPEFREVLLEGRYSLDPVGVLL